MSNTDVVAMSRTELVSWLSAADITDEFADDEFAFDQAVRIMSAETSDEVLHTDEVTTGDDLAGSNFTVLSVSWRKGTKGDKGPRRYALMTCVDVNGEQFLATCGGTKVVLQLRKAEIEGWFPWSVNLDAVSTQNGNTMFQLIAPQKDF